jgi:hypothetical protein
MDNKHQADQGGRIRWKIENEGFNAQKNGGYELEHGYTKDPNAAKIFYFYSDILVLTVPEGYYMNLSWKQPTYFSVSKTTWRDLLITSSGMRLVFWLRGMSLG